ncbi:hypothetical protein pb186bvf_021135 [Paramecium bursaria]
MIPFQCDGDYQFIQHSLEPIVQKKYSRLWKFLSYYIQNQNGNICQKLILSTMKEGIKDMTYLEYSITEGFMDFINQRMICQILKLCLNDKTCQSRMAKNLQIQNNNLTPSIQTSKYQRFFNSTHRYISYNCKIPTYHQGIRLKLTELDEFNDIRLIIMLFDTSRKYLSYDHIVDIFTSQKELLLLLFTRIQQTDHLIEKIIYYYYFTQMDLIKHQTIGYRLSIIDYINKFYSGLIWTDKEIQQLLLSLFDIDIISIKHKMELPDTETLNHMVCYCGPKIRYQSSLIIQEVTPINKTFCQMTINKFKY